MALIFDLPDELLVDVSCHLSAHDVLQLCATSRRWREAITESEQVWFLKAVQSRYIDRQSFTAQLGEIIHLQADAGYFQVSEGWRGFCKRRLATEKVWNAKKYKESTMILQPPIGTTFHKTHLPVQVVLDPCSSQIIAMYEHDGHREDVMYETLIVGISDGEVRWTIRDNHPMDGFYKCVIDGDTLLVHGSIAYCRYDRKAGDRFEANTESQAALMFDPLTGDREDGMPGAMYRAIQIHGSRVIMALTDDDGHFYLLESDLAQSHFYPSNDDLEIGEFDLPEIRKGRADKWGGNGGALSSRKIINFVEIPDHSFVSSIDFNDRYVFVTGFDVVSVVDWSNGMSVLQEVAWRMGVDGDISRISCDWNDVLAKGAYSIGRLRHATKTQPTASEETSQPTTTYTSPSARRSTRANNGPVTTPNRPAVAQLSTAEREDALLKGEESIEELLKRGDDQVLGADGFIEYLDTESVKSLSSFVGKRVAYAVAEIDDTMNDSEDEAAGRIVPTLECSLNLQWFQEKKSFTTKKLNWRMTTGEPIRLVEMDLTRIVTISQSGPAEPVLLTTYDFRPSEEAVASTFAKKQKSG